MSVTRIHEVLSQVARDRYLSRADVQKLFEAAKESGGEIDPAEREALQAILTRYQSRFSRSSRADFERLLNGAQPQVTPTPTEPTRVTHQADNAPWTTTYWPSAGTRGNTDGSPSSNLWAKGGALDKLDELLGARGKPTGARAHELRPNLNWMLSNSAIMKGETRREESGHWVAHSNLSEKDAERTTGVDFNGNGQLDENVEWDFIDAHGRFGTDGKTDGSMSVSWWGSCDKVSLAGILFKEPKKSVTVDGVTFSAQDIKGLLTVIADGQSGGTDFVGNRYDARPDVVHLKNGQKLSGKILTEVDWNAAGLRRSEDYTLPASIPDEVTFRGMDGVEQTFKKSEISLLAREDKQDDAALFHTTIQEWLQSGRAAVMDKDPGDHVWNYSFHKAEDAIYKDGLVPGWGNFEKKDGWNGPAGDGKLTYVERKVQFGENGATETYRYWLEEKDGKVVNSGWAPGSGNPDFLWRPRNEPTFTGANSRNPFVDPALVKELYEKSIE
jgi:hypothetical protein